MIVAADAVSLAERKGRARALVFLFFAACTVTVLFVDLGPARSDFVHGLWVGITTGAALNLLPLGRWLKRGSAVARLLDDESVREHRRTATVAGFWAAMAAALILGFVAADGGGPAPFDVARIIATAAVATALVGFALLELRAARG